MARAYFTTAPRVRANSDPASWPISMRAADVAIVTRQSLKNLYARVKAGTAKPMPVLTKDGDLDYPIRWHRETVRRFVEGA